jgi:heptosyltransferase-1
LPIEPPDRVSSDQSAIASRHSEVSSFLIIKPSSLGDVVHTLPAVALLKRRFPESPIRWLINPEWAPLLDGNPHVNEVIPFPRRAFRGLSGVLRIAPWARSLRATTKVDCVLDFQGLLRSALIARLCRARGGKIIGLSDAREGARYFYDRVVDVGGIAHAVDRYLALVAPLGIDTAQPAEWPLPSGEPVAEVPDGPFILFHPFSRGAGKSLSPEEVQTFCSALAPLRVVIAGRSEANLLPLGNALDLLNRTTLSQLISLIRRAAFVVSVDSGPMHIAAALTERLVSIHTWSDPAKVGPYQPNAWIWKDRALAQMRDLQNGSKHLPCADIPALAAFVAQQCR